MRDEFSTDAATAAAPILDHHRLAQRLADQIAGYAPDNIGISSGGKRYNKMNWPVRIGGQCARRQERQNGRRSKRGNEHAAWNIHRGPPLFVSSKSGQRSRFKFSRRFHFRSIRVRNAL